ncbi:MFS transporter [Virgibacillus sp. W0181]|uniref:MFS transporter n=1 Tax=Virgibacillus sp. W0181 TaxID=3391581 RepID=UPI003F45E38D
MRHNRWFALCIIALAVLFSLSLWFSALVVMFDLKVKWNLNPLTEGFVSSSIPAGFVIGAFISAYSGLADKYNARNIFVVSATAGALLNGLLIFVDSATIGITLRGLTGLSLAGVYPISVKLISQWFPKQRGTATGILLAALTMGSALPHLISVFVFDLDSRFVLLICSALSLIAAFLIKFILVEAPVKTQKAPFSLGLIKNVVKNKPVMLANFGYFGHSWELYGMWAWIPLFLSESFMEASSSSRLISPLVSFIAIGVAGLIGAVAGGLIADKIGRSRLTIIAMLVSGMCALCIGFSYGSSIWLTSTIAIIWGASIIADSAQFSVGVSEFSDSNYVGTALTLQMCVGYSITILSINIIPIIQELVGWRWAFSILSIGPLLGILAMMKYENYERQLKDG